MINRTLPPLTRVLLMTPFCKHPGLVLSILFVSFGTFSTSAYAFCGDGILEAGEACDDGLLNGNRPADCSTSCLVNLQNTCGDSSDCHDPNALCSVATNTCLLPLQGSGCSESDDCEDADAVCNNSDSTCVLPYGSAGCSANADCQGPAGECNLTDNTCTATPDWVQASFEAIYCGQDISYDDDGPNPDGVDIVGGLDPNTGLPNGQNPATEIAFDDGFAYYRVRITADVTANGGAAPIKNFSWAWGFDSDSNFANEWEYFVDYNGVTEQVEFYSGADTSGLQLHSYPAATYSSINDTLVDSNADGKTDWHVAIAIPIAHLADEGLVEDSTKENYPINPRPQWVSTSSNGTGLGKDFACSLNDTDPVCGNGVIEGPESCDDGDGVNGPFPAACSATCLVNVEGSCVNTSQCGAEGAECIDGTCVFPPGGPCASDTNCTPDSVCESNVCVLLVGNGPCDGDDECQGVSVCDPATLTCLLQNGDSTCASGDDCLDPAATCEGGVCDIFDDDNDGVPNGVDPNPNNPDSDGDGLCDGNIAFAGVCISGEDLNLDGVVDPGESDPADPCDPSNTVASCDTDADGVPDGLDAAPNDPDADEDGLCDGNATVGGVCVAGEDTNGNGVVDPGESDPADPCDPSNIVATCDTDADGVPDGLDAAPNDPDADDDGLCDGNATVGGVCVAGEDTNGNGAVDAGESDPADPCDPSDTVPVCDSDADGVPDGLDPAPNDPDADDDGLCDGNLTVGGICVLGEDTNGNGVVDPGESDPNNPCDPNDMAAACTVDTDSDGVYDYFDPNPTNPDTDGDGLCDGDLTVMGVCIAGEDTNGNGVIDPGESDPSDPCDPSTMAAACSADTDQDGVIDFFDAAPNDPDGDGDGLCDGDATIAGVCTAGEDTNGNGVVDPGESDPTDPCDPDNTIVLCDFDTDGVPDGLDAAPDDPDADGDGLCDGNGTVGGVCVAGEDTNGNGVVDPGESDPADPCDPDDTVGMCDADADGVPDGFDVAPNDPDADGDGQCDGNATIDGVCVAGEDTNGDGIVDPGESDPADPCDPDDTALTCDTDNDGVPDGLDNEPNNPDSDGDGFCDGDASIMGVCVAGEDLNGDGVVDMDESDPLDPCDPDDTAALCDTDNDGVPDGLDEEPNNPDTDGDGLCDGNATVASVCVAGEDINGNGIVDPGESDPNNPCDPDSMSDGCTTDSDGDGVSDFFDPDPMNPDTDGDGVCDGDATIAGVCVSGEDLNGDGILDAGESDPTNPCDPDPNNVICLLDSDEDGIPDSLDPAPNDPDADDDGLCDGNATVEGVCTAGEDTNGNGVVDPGESDPTDPCDPNPSALADGDCDGDGLTNGDEVIAGTDPGNSDSDGDGLTDGQEVSIGTDPMEEDSDGDGLTDGNEVGSENNPNDPCDPAPEAVAEGDCDGDGLTNGQETQAGTNLTNPDSDGDGLNDGQEIATGTDPLDSDSDGDGVDDGTEVNEGDDPTDPCIPVPEAFPDADCDGDGLTNGEEVQGGTDPNNSDTDGDGIDDNAEITSGGDPTDPCDPAPEAVASGDCDGDGLTNGEETDAGTDLTNGDSDGDGLSDGDEVTTGTDPLDEDSDGDGVTDGTEVGTGNDPTDPCDPAPEAVAEGDCDGDGLTNGEETENGTDPGNDDSDGDGLTDGEEAATGTDPLVTDSDGDGISDGSEVSGGDDPTDPCDPAPEAVGEGDCDGDGLTNEEEIERGIDPNKPDSDGDGIDDNVEIEQGTDPTDPCHPPPPEPNDLDCSPINWIDRGDDDADGDGLTRAEEEALGTDPDNPDSDGDGFNDNVIISGGGLSCDASNGTGHNLFGALGFLLLLWRRNGRSRREIRS